MDKVGYQCKNVVASSQMFNYSRHDLIRWINVSLDMEVNKVESLCSGAVYCKLLNIIFPGCVPIKRLKHNANQQHEFISNLKILQNAFISIGCNKEVPIDRLILGRYQDNFEFLQWFKRFFDANYGPDAERKSFVLENHPVSKHFNKNKTPVYIGHSAKRSDTGVACAPTPVASTRPVQAVEPQPLASKSKVKILEEKCDNKKEEISALTKERDFYFQKLRSLEVICLEHSDPELATEQQATLSSQILAKLYETEDGFSPPDELEEEAY